MVAVSQAGDIQQDTIFQAKGFYYSATSLLGGNGEIAQALSKMEKFATIYLAPKDYHRVHMPIAGKLLETTYSLKGDLFSVNECTAYVSRP